MEEGYWFKSDLFQIQQGEDEETNPGCYGRALGDWLREQLKHLGYDVEAPIPEDWGWCVTCAHPDYLMWIGCSSIMGDDCLEDYDPEVPPDGRTVTWHAFPAIEVPFFYWRSWLLRLMGKLDTKRPLIKLNQDLKNILDAEPRIECCGPP